MTLNRPYPARGKLPAREAELLAIGELVRAQDAQALTGSTGDTLSTWAITAPGQHDQDRLTRLQLRMPWGLLAVGDPSSHTAVVPKEGLPTAVKIAGIGCSVAGGTAAAQAPVTFDIRWDEWNRTSYTERAKAGITTFAQALAQTSQLG